MRSEGIIIQGGRKVRNPGSLNKRLSTTSMSWWREDKGRRWNPRIVDGGR